jgi:hypothetical protein
MTETAASGDADAPPDAIAVPDPIPDRLNDAVERWWADHFPGSPVAQVTQAWNHAFVAKEELKRRLVRLVAGVA